MADNKRMTKGNDRKTIAKTMVESSGCKDVAMMVAKLSANDDRDGN